MPKVDIDLGHKMGEPAMLAGDAKYYPTVHIESDKKIDFPESGEMTVKFKKIRSEMSDSENGKRYSCTLEVRRIVELYPEEDKRPSKRDTSTEDALDNLAKERSKEKDSDDDY